MFIQPGACDLIGKHLKIGAFLIANSFLTRSIKWFFFHISSLAD
ncbi:hypothetical protein CHCC20375_1004 [Bacillus licheniformis]|nr:hypothetical protein CHCC20375_1004 [Bacillus licheniformis]